MGERWPFDNTAPAGSGLENFNDPNPRPMSENPNPYPPYIARPRPPAFGTPVTEFSAHAVEVYNTDTGMLSRTTRVATVGLTNYARFLRPSEYMIVRAADIVPMT